MQGDVFVEMEFVHKLVAKLGGAVRFLIGVVTFQGIDAGHRYHKYTLEEHLNGALKAVPIYYFLENELDLGFQAT